MKQNELYLYWYFREQSLIDRAIDVFNFLKAVASIVHTSEWETTYNQKIRIEGGRLKDIIL